MDTLKKRKLNGETLIILKAPGKACQYIYIEVLITIAVMRTFYTVTVSCERQNLKNCCFQSETFCIVCCKRQNLKNVAFKPNILIYIFCIFGNLMPFSK